MIIDPAPTPSHLIGRTARVHYHLRLHTYSVKIAGHPVFYTDAIRLSNCKMIIDPRLRAMFEANPRRRTVHALIRGTIDAFDATPCNGEIIRCNPFRYRFFVDRYERHVTAARFVTLHPDKTIEAEGVLTAD
jgi:hypothetical protein